MTDERDLLVVCRSGLDSRPAVLRVTVPSGAVVGIKPTYVTIQNGHSLFTLLLIHEMIVLQRNTRHQDDPKGAPHLVVPD